MRSLEDKTFTDVNQKGKDKEENYITLTRSKTGKWKTHITKTSKKETNNEGKAK